MQDDVLKLGDLELRSRVLLGSSRYPSTQVMLEAIRAADCQLVTVALRRVPAGGTGENLYSILRSAGYALLPNTAGCYTTEEAIRTAELAREAFATNLIKLEVIADDETLLPDTGELVKAADALVRRDFVVLPYTSDDPIVARKLQDVGCAAVMPLAAPIGTGLGIRNPHNLELIRTQVMVPVIVDAGIGTASDVTLAMELGMDGVLLNTAVARAHDPVRMARAMARAAQAGRDAYMAGRMPRRFLAEATSPLRDSPAMYQRSPVGPRGNQMAAHKPS